MEVKELVAVGVEMLLLVDCNSLKISRLQLNGLKSGLLAEVVYSWLLSCANCLVC